MMHCKFQGLKEIDLQMHNYMQTLEIAIQHGLPVLLKNIHENLDPSLDPILNKSIIKIGLYEFSTLISHYS